MRRRRRRRTDWVIAHWDEAESVITAGQWHLIDICSVSDLQEHSDRMTCSRVVGQFWFRGPDVTALEPALHYSYVCLRMFKSDARGLDAGAHLYTGAPQVQYNTSLVANADDEFMWERRYPLGPGDADAYIAGIFLGSLGVSSIDVRVKRRLRNEERICLAVQPFVRDSVGNPLAISYFMHLRALVSL